MLNCQRVAKMGDRIDANATKNLSKIEVASRMRLGSVSGGLRGAIFPENFFGRPFLGPFSPKSRKKVFVKQHVFLGNEHRQVYMIQKARRRDFQKPEL